MANAETLTDTAPVLTPDLLDEISLKVRQPWGEYELCWVLEHAPALIASARRTQQAEAELEKLRWLYKRETLIAAGAGRTAAQNAQQIAEQVAKRRAAEAERDAAVARVTEWETWHAEMAADFCGVTDNTAADRLHDWGWIENHRPSPTALVSQPAGDPS